MFYNLCIELAEITILHRGRQETDWVLGQNSARCTGRRQVTVLFPVFRSHRSIKAPVPDPTEPGT